MTTYHVGQEVFVLRAYSSSGQDNLEPMYNATVTKVGRTRVQVRLYGRDHPFRMDNGYEVADPAQVRIVTPEQLVDERERRDLLQRLDIHSPTWWSRRTLAQLRAIAEIINE